jgi:drug/metabolite transporter (DMT)-like permease
MLALALGLFAALCWSAHDLLARTFSDLVGPFRMAVLTLIVGTALLLGWVLQSGALFRMSAISFGQLVVLGGLYGMAIGSLFKAFSLAPVSIVGPFTAGYPALVVVWGLIGGLTPTPVQYLAVLLILAGGIVVGRMGPDDGGLAGVAKADILPLMFFCCLAVVGFAAAIVVGQHISLALGEVEAAALSRIPAAILLLPFAFNERPHRQKIQRPAWIAILVMASLDVAAVVGINYMGRLPSKEFGAMGISAYGAISVLLAMLILKEKVSSWQWLGIAMIGCGVAGLAMPQ